MANCLSKPKGTAGITYGHDGVCHQIANRILLPSGQLVDKARGYWISEQFFNHYGKTSNHGRIIFCSLEPSGSVELTMHDDPSTQEIVSGKVSAMSNDRTSQSLSSMMEAVRRDGDQSYSIHMMFVKNALEPPSDQEVQALLALRSDLSNEQMALSAQCRHREISKEDYLERMTQLVRILMRRHRDILGPDRFHKIFGDAADQPDGLIDRDVFMSQSH